LSGGLDSATVLYFAKQRGYKCFCLVFDYGQRHKREIISARRIAVQAKCNYQIIKVCFPWKGSALLDKKINIPRRGKGIPSTYVPGRNIIFLSFALSYAETIGAQAIFIGAHVQDYSGYPDCRPEFLKAFSNAAVKGTKAGRAIKVIAPLLAMSKADIVRLGCKLGVPLKLTWSCYRGGLTPCGKCDSCYYRAIGFKKAGINDPTK